MPYRRRRRTTGNVIQSFKKVLVVAPGSRSAGVVLHTVISTGTDSVAAGQTGPTDSQVPTGSVIKQITIQYCTQNLVNIAAFASMCIQKVHSGQTALDPRAVGGNPQRNQVFHQEIFSVGQNQNTDKTYVFNVPKKYQRVREGDTWNFSRVVDQIHTDNVQVIYKFYR